MRNLDHDYLVWLAGFLDGEGSIFICRRPQSEVQRLRVGNVHLSITQSQKAILDEIATAVGNGRVYSKGHVRGNRKPQWFYNITGRAAVKLIATLLPFLRVKKVQAELALTFYGASPEDRLRCGQEIRRLNRPGRVEENIGASDETA